MEWWRFLGAVALVVTVYTPAMVILWTWPATEPWWFGPDGDGGQPLPEPLPLPVKRRGVFLDKPPWVL